MARINGVEYPEHLFYDLDNQIWYAPKVDGTVRAGLTPYAAAFAGEILVFTPKRDGRDFAKDRSFATMEGGKWVSSIRAAFDGVVVGANERAVMRPPLICQDPFGEGWLLVVRPAREDWQAGLTTGSEIAPAYAHWLATETLNPKNG